MGTVPSAYYQFIIDYAPYFYYIHGTGVDAGWGRGPGPAAHAIDFLYAAYYDSQFESKKTEIYNKIVSLADFILTMQCTDPGKKAYGGFKSTETSTSYYSIDGARCIPALLKAYDLTNDVNYYNAAVLAGGTFLYQMQHPPAGIHDQFYGGFCRAVSIDDAWTVHMDIVNFYALTGLKMLYDRTGSATYNTMISDFLSFMRKGLEELWLYYYPPPTGDGAWHRIGLTENEIYDDDFAYALLGLFTYEGWSLTTEKVYESINTVPASADYPGYNANICWAGYIDVVTRKAACEYYDGVTSGILYSIRTAKDKPSLELSVQIVNLHSSEFMFWGVKFLDWSYMENKQSTVTVSWLSILLLNYQPVTTRFAQILRKTGENLTLYSIVQSGDQTSYLEGFNVRAVVRLLNPDELVIEPGYTLNDFIMVYTLVPMRQRDKIRRYGADYEVGPVELFRIRGEPYYYRATCRRLIG